VTDQHPIDLDGKVKLALCTLKLEVPDENPRQGPAQQKADGDDAGGGRQDTNSQAQLAASSNRYPTPQTVWMLGLVMAAAASFSLSCWT
jgi:hypothetical protein